MPFGGYCYDILHIICIIAYVEVLHTGLTGMARCTQRVLRTKAIVKSHSTTCLIDYMLDFDFFLVIAFDPPNLFFFFFCQISQPSRLVALYEFVTHSLRGWV